MRKVLTLFTLVTFLVTGLTLSPVEAASNVTVLVNEKQINFPDQQPYIDKNGRTLVPVRFISEALGANVEWEGKTQTVTISQGDKKIVLKIGESKATVNGQLKTFDTKAVVTDKGRTMVPLRFVSEVLGATVQWVPATRTVRITVNNGYTLPEELKVDVKLFPVDNPAKADIRIAIDTNSELEVQFKDAEDILASKFDPKTVKEIIDYARIKKTRNDAVPIKYWTVSNQLVEVGSHAGNWAVIILIWQPGVSIE